MSSGANGRQKQPCYKLASTDNKLCRRTGYPLLRAILAPDDKLRNHALSRRQSKRVNKDLAKTVFFESCFHYYAHSKKYQPQDSKALLKCNTYHKMLDFLAAAPIATV